ncbi:MAG: hypothetical protein M3072_09475 [Candidatus Dormibacteraeota bacterium]|nr:hypothetical protein [Candidatus Dormibacteraeota bacterium]
MKTPPPADDHVLPPLRSVPQRDFRFLVFAGVMLVALALGLQSDLVGSQIWALSGGLVLLAAAVLVGYLRVESRLPAIEHFVPVALAAVALTGVALLSRGHFLRYAVAAAAFGLAFAAVAQLDYRHLRAQAKPGHLIVQDTVLVVCVAGAFLGVLIATQDLAIRLGAVFTIAGLAGYRSFRVLGTPIPGRPALMFAALVAELVTFFAWALSATAYFGEGLFAVMLMLIWYVNRGFVRHTYERSLTRQVFLEYGLLGLLAAFLFFVSRQPLH